MRLQLPARLGKYELEECLGGGMSEVYRARDTVIGRTVAVKLLTEEACADTEVRTRFMLEAQMSGNLQHDHIVKIYDCSESEKWGPYIVMEFLQGENLEQAIKEGRTGDLRNKLRIALELAGALEHVHSCQIIHRDLKPQNVHITPTGAVKLMDFGIAKAGGFDITREGYALGTAYYMSPEQVRGKNITHRADVYGFGALLFKLLTGTRAISADSIEQVFYCILNEPLDTKPLHDAGIPQPISDLVARCVAKNPADRPQNFGIIRQELEGILRHMDSPIERRRQPRITSHLAIGGALLAALVLAVVGLVALHPWRAAPAKPRLQPVVQTTAKASDGPRVVKKAELTPVLSRPTGEMVLVKAGNFLLGKERQPASLPDFYIDRTEVTNAAYQRFSEETGNPLPEAFPANKPDYPVVNITIEDARQFAAWAGKRLPTSREWEKAARGTEGAQFPWGNEKDPTRANVEDNPMLAKHEIMPVNEFESGASVFGARQMVGNVWEFVDEMVTPDPRIVQRFAKSVHPPPRPEELWYLIRGESYAEPLAGEVMYDASTIPARFKDPTVGFRCVKDAPGTAVSKNR